MKRISLWALSTLSAVVLLFGYSTSTSGPLATSETTSVQSGSYGASASSSTSSGSTSDSGSSTGSGTSSSTTTSGSTTSGTSTTSGSTSSASKTYSGDVAQTRWGPVQVQITVASGKISNVSVLEYPSGNGRDQEINSYALPILTQETIDAQSANIDMVSGATVTSDGYLQSLQSAIDKAAL
jgi:uncharacterized protein with FMN-binding domain